MTASEHRQSFRERQSAYHEAAHAVVGYVLGQPCLRVTIRPGGGYGTCVFGDPSGIPRRLREGDVEAVEWAERRMIVLAAGAEAERILLGVTVVSGDGDDRVAIQNLLSDLLPPPTMDAIPEVWGQWERRHDEQLGRILRKAKKIITSPVNHAAIETLATRLLEIFLVSGEEARAIIESASATSDAS